MTNKKYSQLGQDHWVLKHVNKAQGTYVEIGAHDGIELSNTYLLEQMGWIGLCVEPNQKSFKKLVKNRNCLLDNRAVLHKSNLMLKFNETEDASMSQLNEGLSVVKTVSLNDLLDEHNIHHVDYISLDVEGFEYDILSTFDFNKYKVKCWTIEHNVYSTKDWANYGGILHKLLSNNYLVKSHDRDFFAVLDDIEPEFYMNYEPINKEKK